MAQLRPRLTLAAALAVALAAAPTALADDACAAFAEPGRIPGAVAAAASAVPADPETGAPAHCAVTATLSPVEGSAIGVIYRLPESWNGKVLGLGGGGWMGNVSLPPALPGLQRGYATMQTDGGHAAGSVMDTSWAVHADGRPNMVAIDDFGHRAVHEMTVAGKAVADAYYGRAHERAYWQGCSTGGRQGLMEVQRHPTDYDGVIAGAPVYDLRVQTGGWVRTMNFQPTDRRLSPAHPALLAEAVRAVCDADDGAADGIVQDPRACAWDPGALACAAGDAGDHCLTPGQVDAVRVAYEGVLLADGGLAAFPLSRGSEESWTRFTREVGPAPGDAETIGMSGLSGALFGDPRFDMNAFDPERDVPRARASALAEVYEADDPEIAPFVARGGKLLLWHGFYDNGPSPIATASYYESVVREADVPTGDAVRLFLAPGVGHCRGGPGPDQFDLLSVLEDWVEQGRAPDEILASKAASDLAWPLCAYPKLPRGRQGPDGTVAYGCE
jgi:feruloyl esterase